MALIKCKECGHEVSDKASACPNCGCPISEINSKICEECGSPIPNNVSKCPNCGCPVKEVEGKKRFSPKKLFGVMIPLLLIAAIVGICYWSLNGKGGSHQIALSQELATASEKYDEIHRFHEGLALVVKSGKYGYINERGEEVIPCQRKAFIYRDGELDETVLPEFNEGMAVVYTFSENDDGLPDSGTLLYGYINERGEEVIPIQYKEAGNFSEGVAPVTDRNGRQLFIDKKGAEVLVIDESMYCVTGFHDGLAYASMREERNYGFIDKTGRTVISMKYQWVRDFSDGLAYVDGDGFKGFIDTKGNEVISCKDYECVGDFHEGLASVVLRNEDGQWIDWRLGFIDKQGNLAIPVSLPVMGYEGGEPMLDMEYFSDGLYCVRENDGMGAYFIDKTGKRVINVEQGITVDPYSEGLALIDYQMMAFGFMDKQGNITLTKERMAEIDEQIKQQRKREEEERLAEEHAEQERQRQAQERKEVEIREVKSWLEGNWRYEMSLYGMTSEARVGISGDCIVVMIDGQHYYSGTYTIEGDKLVYNRGRGSSDYFIIDMNNRRLMADDRHPMQRF